MNTAQAYEAVRGALAAVAPEVDLDSVSATERLRTAADLDSLDFLSLVENLRSLTGVDIPEADYPAVETVDGLTSYLSAHAA